MILCGRRTLSTLQPSNVHYCCFIIYIFSISKDLNFDISTKVLDLLGVCSKTFKIAPGIIPSNSSFPGLLAEGTRAQISNALEGLLVENGIASDVASRLTSNCLDDGSSLQHENPKQLHNLHELFSILKQHGIQIGVCTSDNRAGVLH